MTAVTEMPAGIKARPLAAFLYSIPVSLLAGLIGLGGAEFRLPVIVGLMGETVRRAVPVNLAVSLVTLVAALVTRGRVLEWRSLLPLLPAVAALFGGVMVTSFYGPGLVRCLSDEKLTRAVLLLLMAVGVALIFGSFLPQTARGVLPPDAAAWRVAVGVGLGLAVGLVSSLGIAGGQLMIAVLMFVFGADIKTAGTASLLINLPKVAINVARYRSQGAFGSERDMKNLVLPMALGSMAGATAGGLLVDVAPVGLLKIGLGALLLFSSLRIFRKPKVARVGK